MHSLHLGSGSISIRGGRRRGEEGRYSLDDRRVEAVEAAVEPDALKGKETRR